MRHYDVTMPRGTRRGRPPHADVLTPTEWRITHAVQHGMTNREIATRRGTSVDAVKFHVANVLAKLGVRNRRELRQMLRKPAGSALRRRTTVTTAPLTLGALGQIARSVRDAAVSEAWYRDVLGLPHLYSFASMAFLDLGGTRLMLSEADPPTQTESILYFRTEDIEAAHGTLKARGVEFINAPHLIHRHADGREEWMCFFKDSEGRPLALLSQVAPPATAP